MTVCQVRSTKAGSLAVKVGAGQLQIQNWLAVRLVAGVDQLQRLSLVTDAETFLLTGRRILGIIDSVAPEQGVFRFHVHDGESCSRTVATR
jgi:hypothetical protein